MSRNIRLTLGASIAALAVLFSLPGRGHAVDEARIMQLEQQLQAMQEAMSSMQGELQSLRAQEQEEKEARAEQVRQQNVLAEEVDKLRTSLTLPDFTPLTMDDSVYGLGPAASKIYGVERGLSIGGYGEAFYRKDVSDKSRSDRDTTDYLRFVLYTGYKFTDRIILNAELEFEHASTSTGGSVSVEFAYLDFLMWDWANFRAGMLLAPLGIVNELHEPVFFNGVERPEVERRIIPSTWRENGIGVFGELLPGLEYRVYAMNALEGAESNTAACTPDADGNCLTGPSLKLKEHYRSTRQKGGEAMAEDIALAARIDYSPMLNAKFGASVYTGKSTHDSQYYQCVEFECGKVDLPGARLTIWDLHAMYSWQGLDLRALFAMSHLQDSDKLNEIGGGGKIAKKMYGFYTEAAYDVMPWVLGDTEQQLSPFLRFSYIDQHAKMAGDWDAKGRYEHRIWTTGISYKPHPNVVLKVDYRNFDTLDNAYEREDEVNFGLGFVF